MCEKRVSIKFEPQKTSESDELQGSNVNIPYKGPSTGMDTSLKSRTNMKYFLKSNQSFEITSDICDHGSYIETKGKLKIEDFISGPFDTIGSKIEFQGLYFHFKNILFHLHVKYSFNPLLLCRKHLENESNTISQNLISSDSTINIDMNQDGLLLLTVDPENGLSFENYFVTNGTDESNVNALFYDLQPSFSDYKSIFRPFYDSFINVYDDISILSHSIRNEFLRVICEYQKTNMNKNTTSSDDNVKIPHVLYKEKLEHIKKLNIDSILFKHKSIH